jgi:hypothetical protein
MWGLITSTDKLKNVQLEYFPVLKFLWQQPDDDLLKAETRI